MKPYETFLTSEEFDTVVYVLNACSSLNVLNKLFGDTSAVSNKDCLQKIDISDDLISSLMTSSLHRLLKSPNPTTRSIVSAVVSSINELKHISAVVFEGRIDSISDETALSTSILPFVFGVVKRINSSLIQQLIIPKGSIQPFCDPNEIDSLRYSRWIETEVKHIMFLIFTAILKNEKDSIRPNGNVNRTPHIDRILRRLTATSNEYFKTLLDDKDFPNPAICTKVHSVDIMTGESLQFIHDVYKVFVSDSVICSMCSALCSGDPSDFGKIDNVTEAYEAYFNEITRVGKEHLPNIDTHRLLVGLPWEHPNGPYPQQEWQNHVIFNIRHSVEYVCHYILNSPTLATRYIPDELSAAICCIATVSTIYLDHVSKLMHGMAYIRDDSMHKIARLAHTINSMALFAMCEGAHLLFVQEENFYETQNIDKTTLRPSIPSVAYNHLISMLGDNVELTCGTTEKGDGN